MQQKNKKLWFKRKSYGWGWYPVTWQGWVVVALYVLVMLGFSYINQSEAPDGNLLVGFVFPFIFFTSILILICYKKGESPRWQWGPEEKKVPKVGVGVMILKEGKVLLGKRKGSHGQGEYAWPGGHLEYMESIIECAKRETIEETGIEITNVRFLRLYNLKKYAPKHYIDIGMMAEWSSGEPQVLEPDKCESWDWYDVDNLPSPLFETIPSYIEAHKTGKNFYDTM